MELKVRNKSKSSAQNVAEMDNEGNMIVESAND